MKGLLDIRDVGDFGDMLIAWNYLIRMQNGRLCVYLFRLLPHGLGWVTGYYGLVISIGILFFIITLLLAVSASYFDVLFFMEIDFDKVSKCKTADFGSTQASKFRAPRAQMPMLKSTHLLENPSVLYQYTL